MEEAIYQALLAQDIVTQEKICNDYYKLVYSITYNILKNKDDATYTAYDTFSKAFKKIILFDGTNFPAWISKIARNLALNKLREKEKLTLYKIPEHQEVEDESWNLDVIKNELKDILSEKEIDILIRHNFYGQTFKKIALDYKLPLGSICSLHKRAIDKVKNSQL